MVYSGAFDATVCLSEDRWDESLCSDPGCDFCSQRPPKPSDAADLGLEDVSGE